MDPRGFDGDVTAPVLALGTGTTQVDADWPGDASANAEGDSLDGGVSLVTYGGEVRAGVENILKFNEEILGKNTNFTAGEETLRRNTEYTRETFML